MILFSSHEIYEDVESRKFMNRNVKLSIQFYMKKYLTLTSSYFQFLIENNILKIENDILKKN